jgi:hypothetical protein
VPYADPIRNKAYHAEYRLRNREHFAAYRKARRSIVRSEEERALKLAKRREAYLKKKENVCRVERERQAKIPAEEKTAAKRLKRYGMTQYQYDELLADQKFVCALCTEKPAVDIDHCHEGGHVRGLLCRACNLGLGMFKDSPALLLKAIEYVSRRNEER